MNQHIPHPNELNQATAAENEMPKRSVASVLLVFVMYLLAAPVVGVVTSYYAAPGSLLALLIGFLWLFVTYKISYYTWMLADFLSSPVQHVKQSVTAVKELGQTLKQAMQEGESTSVSSDFDGDFDRSLPQGGAAFVIAFLVCSVVTGAFVGFFLSRLDVLPVTIAYTVVGTLFGISIYVCARVGLFPITDELVSPE